MDSDELIKVVRHGEDGHPQVLRFASQWPQGRGVNSVGGLKRESERT